MGLNPWTFAHDSVWHILPQHTHCLTSVKPLLNYSPPHPCLVTMLERTPLLFKPAVVPSLCLTVTPGSRLPPTPLHHHPAQHTQCVSILFAGVTPMLATTGSNKPVLGHGVQERWLKPTTPRGQGVRGQNSPPVGTRDVSGNALSLLAWLTPYIAHFRQTDSGSERYSNVPKVTQPGT